MRKSRLFCLAALLLAARAHAGLQQDFAAANRLYAEGQTAAALAGYLRLAPLADDWQLPYNIGNCYYKMGRYLSAKFYYLKARKLRPLEPALLRNIAMTNRRFRDDARLPAPDFVTRAAQRLAGAVSADALSGLLLLALALFNVLLFRLLTRGRSRARGYALGFALLAAVAIGALQYGRARAAGGASAAIVWTGGAQLRSGPGEDNTVLFQVHPGLEVRIIDRSTDWVQVTASERIAGWVEKSRLALI
jgi:tetratricopeptide (TPR) repeat protein